MYIPAVIQKDTGIEFIDKYHQVMEEIINNICEKVTTDHDIEKIIIIIDELIEEVSPYLESKKNCHDKYQCQCPERSTAIFQHLIEFKETMVQFGDTLPNAIAIHEIRQWAKSTIFEPDQECISCPHMKVSN